MNYTQIREEGGKRYLFDADKYRLAAARVDSLAELVKRPREILKKYDYPDTPEWQQAIIRDGKAGLEAAIVAENDKQAERLKIPRYVAAQWRKQAVADTPAEMWEEVDRFTLKFMGDANEAGLNAADISYNRAGNCVLAADAIKARLKLGYSLEITPKMQAEAQAAKDCILSLRPLNEAGVDIKNLIEHFLGNRYAPRKYPALDELPLLVEIMRTRQQTQEQLRASNPNAYYGTFGGDREETQEEGAE